MAWVVNSAIHDMAVKHLIRNFNGVPRASQGLNASQIMRYSPPLNEIRRETLGLVIGSPNQVLTRTS